MSKHAEDEGWGIRREGIGWRVTWGPYGDRCLSTPVLNKADAMALVKLAQDRDDLLEALKNIMAHPMSTKAMLAAHAAIAKAEGK